MPKLTDEEVKTLQADLAQFTGTEQYHKFSLLFPNLVLTDGVKFLCEKTGFYWMMDIIGSYQSKCRKDPMLQDMQFWKLKVFPKVENKPRKYVAIVTCERDTDDVAITQKLEYTDFPLSEIKLYVQRGERYYTIMLPSEY